MHINIACFILLFRLQHRTNLLSSSSHDSARSKRNASDDTNRRGRSVGGFNTLETDSTSSESDDRNNTRVCVKRGGGRSGHQRNVLYWVTQQVQILGWVDFDLESYPVWWTDAA